MRTLVIILLCSVLVNLGLCQGPSTAPAGDVWIHRFIIDSKNIPEPERNRLIRSFLHRTYAEAELQTRIQVAVRDLGYYKAIVDEPRVSLVGQQEDRKNADVTVWIDAGAQYRLGEIRFLKAGVFPADRMRKVFPMQSGNLFAVSSVRIGLEELRKLYVTRGYVNFVAVPQPEIDEFHRTIALTIDVDEGKPFNFGRLILQGIEPHPGAGRTLLESWKAMEGRRYNPVVLKRWLLANRSDWPARKPLQRLATTVQDYRSSVVNVELVFQ